MKRASFAILLILALSPGLTAARETSTPAAAIGLSSTDITTVDRLTITIDITLPPGRTIEPFLPGTTRALEAAGWSVISGSTTPPRLGTDGSLTHRASFLVEPFLPGEYSVPPFDITTIDQAGGTHTITTQPAKVTVRSVLPDDEADQLPQPGVNDTSNMTGDAPLGDLRPPPDEPRPGPLIAVIVGVLVFTGIAFAARAALATRRPPTRDPIRDLERLARGGQNADSLDAAERAFRECLRISAGDGVAGLATSRVAAALHQRGINHEVAAGCADILCEFEHARYAPTGDRASGESIASRALSLARKLREAGGHA